MNEFTLKVEVSLSPETLDALKRIAAASIFANLRPEDQEQVRNETPKDEPVATAATPEAPAEPAAEETPAAEAEDMPDFELISDDTLAQVTRDTVSRLKENDLKPILIRSEVFKKYGISQSTDCPQERRAEFVKDMQNLGKAS